MANKVLEKRLYSVKEAALYYGISVSTMYKFIRCGTFPEIRIGRRLYLDFYDLNDYIDFLKHLDSCEECRKELYGSYKKTVH